MTARDPRWIDANDRFLAASLAWLRLRIERARGTPSEPVNDLDARIEHAARVMADAESAEHPPALITLARRFGLSRFERDVLLLCASSEFDPQAPTPTFGLALMLFDNPAWDALQPSRPLRYWRLIEINQPGAVPLTASPLRADERIVSYIKGLNTLDDRIRTIAAAVDDAADASSLAPSQQAAVQALVRHWSSARTDISCVQLSGADAASKSLVAHAAASALGLSLQRVRFAWLPSDPPSLETFARLWERENQLLPLALLIDANDLDHGSGPEKIAALARLLSHGLGLVALDVREPLADSVCGPAVAVERPTPNEQRDAWIALLGDAREPEATLLATQFAFSLTEIRRSAVDAAARPEQPGRIWHSCLTRSRAKLDPLASRIEPRASWRDLVLPPQERRLLHAIARQATRRYTVYETWGFRRTTQRGLGIAALFAGESGTGKTMAAEVIAKHLCLNLHRIDLSSIVSKYIGETEKNLRRLFDAAEDGGSILLFDEADALFGRRSEVKDSHDRYANIEINYLLQRMETFNGLTILATNMKSALDPAFLRRLRFVVNFPFPGPAERHAIWRKAFPREAPVERADSRLRVEIRELSRLNLTGGSIHNVAMNSAFLAAARRDRITMPIVLEAVRMELRKLDKPVSEIDRSVGEKRQAARA